MRHAENLYTLSKYQYMVRNILTLSHYTMYNEEKFFMTIITCRNILLVNMYIHCRRKHIAKCMVGISK